MKNNIFDVLVVYSGKITNSASSSLNTISTPFATNSRLAQYNHAYSYFLNTCAEKGLKAAFTTTKDITGAGTCRSFWRFSNNSWVKVKESGYSTLIFDKFSPAKMNYREASRMLFSSKQIRPFNNAHLRIVFDDKQMTFDTLGSFSIPTVPLVSNSIQTITDSIKAMRCLTKTHLQKNDFSESVILKDRFGTGGQSIFKIDNNFQRKIIAIQKKHSKTSFILQPFVKFEKGYKSGNLHIATDIRIIYQKNRIIQAYIRTAKKDDFRCNEHQGGTVKYIPEKDLPARVVTLSRKIANLLDKKSALFALDFIISNNGNIYFLEGNINPGIYWGAGSKDDEVNTKKLIHSIIKELVIRSAKPHIQARIKKEKLFPTIPFEKSPSKQIVPIQLV